MASFSFLSLTHKKINRNYNNNFDIDITTNYWRYTEHQTILPCNNKIICLYSFAVLKEP